MNRCFYVINCHTQPVTHTKKKFTTHCDEPLPYFNSTNCLFAVHTMSYCFLFSDTALLFSLKFRLFPLSTPEDHAVWYPMPPDSPNLNIDVQKYP